MVVFLHGVPTSPALWDGVRARLGRPSSAPLLPGSPGRPLPPDPTPAAFAAALLAEVPAGAHLVGHDYGGLVALHLAPRMAAASVTLCSTTVGLGWLPARLGALPPVNRLFYRRWAGARWIARGVHPSRRTAARALFPGWNPAVMEAIARRLPLGAPARPGCPVRLLWGTADRSLPAPHAWALARRYDAALDWLPGGRHLVVWEDPEGAAQALRAAWDRPPSA